MKYLEFRQKLEKLKIFSLQDIKLIDSNFRMPTLYEWESKGWVKKIRNTWYVFGGFEPSDYDYYLIANRIYAPSYVSLESALNFYGIIPEAVQQITSITTLKTNEIDTEFGYYTYGSIKELFFVGYAVIDDNNIGVRMASLEKAILDTLYLNNNIKSTVDFESRRYNRELLKERLDQNQLQKYLTIFNNESLQLRVNALLKYINQ